MGTRDRDDGHVRDVLVQEARADNPGSRFVQLGITMSINKVIEPGDVMHKYRVVTGTVKSGTRYRLSQCHQ